jgi:ribonuclease BN (tRNA processing enzyme)
MGSRAGLVYSGDCGEAEDLLALVRPGDTLLCEASFGAEPVPAGVAHLNARAAAGTARAGAAGRLVLTHLQPGYDAAAASAAAGVIFSGETLLARPGLLLAL